MKFVNLKEVEVLVASLHSDLWCAVYSRPIPKYPGYSQREIFLSLAIVLTSSDVLAVAI